MKRLGAETIPQIVTRGWLVDVARLGLAPVTWSPSSSWPASIPSRATRCSSTPAGARTGRTPRHTSQASPAPATRGRVARRARRRAHRLRHLELRPGAGRGSDEAVRGAAALNAVHGVFVVENLNTAELARDGVREFALVLTHPKLRGATGAWTSPIALI